jgi:hypothetical protein
VWNVRNTALDPNTWLNNHTIDPVTGKTATRNWSNNHEYTVSYGGPIKKNKTFFYTLWEQQIHRERVLVDGGVLTDTARLGIMRFFDGWKSAAIRRPEYCDSDNSNDARIHCCRCTWQSGPTDG